VKQQREDGPENDFQVEQGRPVIDIKDIQFASGVNVVKVPGFPAKSFRLCQTCYSRFDGVAKHEVIDFGRKFVIHGYGMWPGTHNGHVSFDDIKKLWQFVQTGFSQNFSDRGDPRVVFCGLHGVCLIVYVHGSKLVTIEGDVVLSVAELLEDQWALGSEFYQHSDDGKKPGKNENHKTETDHQIHCPLDDLLGFVKKYNREGPNFSTYSVDSS
jgi:hypothetical protein